MPSRMSNRFCTKVNRSLRSNSSNWSSRMTIWVPTRSLRSVQKLPSLISSNPPAGYRSTSAWRIRSIRKRPTPSELTWPPLQSLHTATTLPRASSEAISSALRNEDLPTPDSPWRKMTLLTCNMSKNADRSLSRPISWSRWLESSGTAPGQGHQSSRWRSAIQSTRLPLDMSNLRSGRALCEPPGRHTLIVVDVGHVVEEVAAELGRRRMHDIESDPVQQVLTVLADPSIDDQADQQAGQARGLARSVRPRTHGRIALRWSETHTRGLHP